MQTTKYLWTTILWLNPILGKILLFGQKRQNKIKTKQKKNKFKTVARHPSQASTKQTLLIVLSNNALDCCLISDLKSFHINIGLLFDFWLEVFSLQYRIVVWFLTWSLFILTYDCCLISDLKSFHINIGLLLDFWLEVFSLQYRIVVWFLTWSLFTST